MRRAAAAALIACVAMSLTCGAQVSRLASYSTNIDIASYPSNGAWAIDNSGNACGGSAGYWTKLKPDGSPAWSVFYANANWSDVRTYAAAIDALGNCYIAGYGQVVPTAGAYQSRTTGMFFLKFGPSGAVVYATYLDGSGGFLADLPSAIAADAEGNLWIVGSTSSNDFPLVNQIQSTMGGTNSGFVAKLNPTGSTLLFSSYLNPATLTAVAVDNAGNAYLTGVATSSAFPTTAGSVQPTFAATSGGNAFVMKLTSAGMLTYSTFVGQSTAIRGQAITADASGNAYMVGHGITASFTGVAVAKLDATGANLAYLKLFGAELSPNNVTVDSNGSVFISGTSATSGTTTQLPLLSAIEVQQGATDAFIVQLDSAGMLQFSTYLGSNDYDGGGPIGADDAGNIFLVASTSSPYFPVLNAYSGTISSAQNPWQHWVMLKLARGSGPAFAIPNALAFGKFDVGQTSGGLPFVLANLGTTAINVSNVAVAGDFSATFAAPLTLAPGAQPHVSVTFTPTATGTRTGTLTFTDDAPGSPHVIQLTGFGKLNQPAVSLSTASLVFSPQPLTTTSPGKSVTLTNTGDGTLTVTRVDITGDFAETNSCSTVIAGGKCTFWITFTPTWRGTRTGQITITDNAADSPHVIALSGSGTAPTAITVTSPNGGETWAVGSTQAITWNYLGASDSMVRIDLLKQGRFYTTITTAISIGSSGSTGSFFWTVPGGVPAGNDYGVQVTSAIDPAITDSSDAQFTIAQPSPGTLNVTSPNGGETWAVGSTQMITWSYTGSSASLVRIDLLKQGRFYTTITPSTSVGSLGAGSFSWTVPSGVPAGNDYGVQVTSAANATITDSSDAQFTVAPSATVTVSSPNGGETWGAGTTKAITWSYTGSPASLVRIDLLKQGRFYTSISSSIAAGSGSYTWTVPDGLPSGNDYSVQVTSLNDTAVTDTSNANFSVVLAGTITVTSPNGGETLAIDSAQTITWSYTGTPGALAKIELLKQGRFYTTISFSTPVGSAGSGSFVWTVPTGVPAGNDYSIQVTSIMDGTIADTSNANFTVTSGATITITSPNGGESWAVGTAQAITWSYTGAPGTQVKIELLKQGRFYTTIGLFVPIGSAGSGSFLWTIPKGVPGGNDYTVQVTSMADASIADTSNASFTVLPQAITVTSPNGGETWNIAKTQPITWSYTGSPTALVRIELLNQGNLYTTITASTSAASGSYNWTLPYGLDVGNAYTIRITSTTDATLTDTSNAPFAVAVASTSTITVTSPVGGETWAVGTAHTITWNYTDLPGAQLKIDLLKQGRYYTFIGYSNTSGSAGSGSFPWTISAGVPAGTDYRIRVSVAANAAIVGTSSSDFTVGP